jgi:hypothetical protein
MSYIQQCETHNRSCKPANCPDVRLYHLNPRVQHSLTCTCCGGGFTAGRTDAKYCSTRCRTRAHRVTDKPV